MMPERFDAPFKCGFRFIIVHQAPPKTCYRDCQRTCLTVEKVAGALWCPWRIKTSNQPPRAIQQPPATRPRIRSGGGGAKFNQYSSPSTSSIDR